MEVDMVSTITKEVTSITKEVTGRTPASPRRSTSEMGRWEWEEHGLAWIAFLQMALVLIGEGSEEEVSTSNCIAQL